jgi:hypothetical protein
VDSLRSSRPSSLSSSRPLSAPSSTLPIPLPRPSCQEIPLGHRRPGGTARRPLAAGFRRGSYLAEGGLVLVGIYVLIGAGIGDAAGSVMVGIASGVVAGLGAVAAILLIIGSERASRASGAAGE